VLRLNAASGEHEELAQGVVWNGVGSELEGNGLALAPEAQSRLLPTGPDPRTWPCHPFGEAIACIRIPPEWTTWSWSGDTGHRLTFGNLAHAVDTGWFSLREGAIRIQVTQFTLPPDIPTPIPDPATEADPGFPFETVLIGGREARHALYPAGNNHYPEFLFLPSPQGSVTVLIQPASAYRDPVVQEILQSIRFSAEDR